MKFCIFHQKKMEELKPISFKFPEEISHVVQQMIKECMIIRDHDDVDRCDMIYIYYKQHYRGVDMADKMENGDLCNTCTFHPYLFRSMGEQFYRFAAASCYKISRGDMIIFISDTGEDIRVTFQAPGELLITEEELAALLAFPFSRITIGLKSGGQRKYYFKQGEDGAMLLKWMMWKIHEEAMKKVEGKV